VYSKITKAVKNLGNAVSTADKLGGAAKVAKKTVSSAKKGASEAAAKVAGAVTSTASAAKKTATKVTNKVQSAVKKVSGAVSSATKKVSEGLNQLKSNISSKLNPKSAEVKVDSGSSATKISPEMEKKILEGQRKSPIKNEVIGGHSSQINNSKELFAVEEVSVNADGTRNIRFIKDLQDGNISKI